MRNFRIFAAVALSTALAACGGRQPAAMPTQAPGTRPAATRAAYPPAPTAASPTPWGYPPAGSATPPPPIATGWLSTGTARPAVATTAPAPLPTWTVFSTAAPACQAGADLIHCRDDVLGIEFDYAPAWGTISAELRSGADAGYAYEYAFSHAGRLTGPFAAGRSRDFAEGRGRWWTDFAGFGTHAAESWCAANPDDAALCRVIGPDVVVDYYLPRAKDYCDPDPSVTGALAFIRLDLPDHPYLHGFVFVTHYFSEATQAEVEDALRATLGWTGQASPSDCAAERQAEFDQQMAALLARVQAGTAEAGTLAKVAQAEALARSIRVGPAPAAPPSIPSSP